MGRLVGGWMDGWMDGWLGGLMFGKYIIVYDEVWSAEVLKLVQ